MGKNFFNDINKTNGNIDSDNDGLSDIEEYKYDTNPKILDTDGDGYRDKTEIKIGTNPHNINNYPDKPILDIQANNSNESINITKKSLKIYVSLDCKNNLSQNFDYWVAASTNEVWYFLNKNVIWQKSLTRCISAPLINFNNVVIPNPPLVAGKNIIYFGIDDTPDGDLAEDQLWFDFVEVNIQ